MKCVAAIIARNEADRYLATVIQSLQPLCTDIILLDDGSEDQTVDLANAMGCQVRFRDADPMWGQESHARSELWQWGSEIAGDGWLLIADADQQLVADPAAWRMMLTSLCPSWSLPLYDCWNRPDQYRADGYWQGYRLARPWLFRPIMCPDPVWPDRGIHCGHSPANFPGPTAVAPDGVYWKHFGWMTETDRDTKTTRYLSTQSQLTPHELAHLRSVEDR